jgi:hypothetical protein
MKKVSLRKISLILGLMLFCATTALGYIGYSPTFVKGDSMSDFTTNKLQADAQKNALFLQKANKYLATRPKPIPVTLTVDPDPKVTVESIPREYGWFGFLYHGPEKVTELWIVGDKLNSNHLAWNTLYAYSGSLKSNPQQGLIGTYINNDASNDSWAGDWNTPQLWGAVTITNVTGDIVSFSTVSGVNGTFNLTTHAWTTN